MKKLHLFVMVAILILPSCASKEEKVRSAFEKRVAEDLKIVEKNIQIPRVNKYTKMNNFAKTTGAYSIDIEKTDSIISPFLGKLAIDIAWYHDNEFLTNQKIIANYSFQDDKWILKKAYRLVESGIQSDKDDMDWALGLFERK